MVCLYPGAGWMYTTKKKFSRAMNFNVYVVCLIKLCFEDNCTTRYRSSRTHIHINMCEDWRWNLLQSVNMWWSEGFLLSQWVYWAKGVLHFSALLLYLFVNTIGSLHCRCNYIWYSLRVSVTTGHYHSDIDITYVMSFKDTISFSHNRWNPV